MIHESCKTSPQDCPDVLTCDAYETLTAAIVTEAELAEAQAQALAVEAEALEAEARAAEDAARPLMLKPKVESDLAQVLRDVTAYIRRYVVADDRYYPILALWVVHTWCFDASEVTPYLWIASPEMGSGKTRLLEVLEVLVAKPWRVVEPTEAVTFRMIHSVRPTLLLDEVDLVFARDRGHDAQAGLRGVFNSGYRRGAVVPRAADFGRKLESFSTYCPKAFAGIGRNLPDTVVDRSIKVPLRRRLIDEVVERFSTTRQMLEAEPLRERIKDAASAADPFLREWREWLPPEALLSSDRHAEVWEPLFAISEAAGHEWPVKARELAEWTSEERARNLPPGILLLQHVRDAFGEDTQFLSSTDLMRLLVDRDDGPWVSYWELQTRKDLMELARKLREFEVHPVQRREGDDRARGYERRDLLEAWRRYLPREGPEDPSDSTDST
jgi:hypothetical protein